MIQAPKNTPHEIVDRLSHAVVDAMAMPDIKEAVAKFGMEARGESSEELSARIKRDVAKWADVIDKAGIEKK